MKTLISLLFAAATLTFVSCMGGNNTQAQPEAVVEESVIEVAVDTTTAPVVDTTTVPAVKPTK